jgi:hypothetical protein
VERRPPVALAAARGLAKIADEDDASDVGYQLAFCSFGPAKQGVVPKLADADDEVRVLLGALAGAPLAWTYSDVPMYMRGHGLADTREAFEAWLTGA